MKEKNNRRKILLIALIVFAIAGVIGYGVYSYYWAEGNVTVTSDAIRISKFDVEVSKYADTNSKTFIASSPDFGEEASCSYNSEDNKFHCSANLTIYNDGDNDVVLSASDFSASFTNSDYGELEIVEVTSDLDGSLSSGSERHFSVSATVKNNDSSYVYTNDTMSTQLYQPVVYSANTPVEISFKITATEVHD